MAEPPKIITGNGGTTPKFVFEPPSAQTEGESFPKLKSSSSQPNTSSSQPSSPKLRSPKQSSSQPTSPKLSATRNNALKSPTQTTMTAGSATGNPRNKCALQPGHSLMDWIRLGNSGKDLTGVGGRLRAVSPKELAAHNTPGDAWLSVRGRVYNVSHYLPYHPGGQDELLRGIGTDATQLFDKVHPWVNYESLLAKCLVGPLRTDYVDAQEFFGEPAQASKSTDRLKEPSKAQELVRKSMENLANCITPVRKRISAKTSDSEPVKSGDSNPSKIMQSLIHSSELPVSISRRAASSPVKETESIPELPSPPKLRFDWIQTSSRLTVSVYTRALVNPGASARLAKNGALMLDVAYGETKSRLTLEPERPLRGPLLLRLYPESGKVEVSARKAESGVWRGAGEARSECSSLGGEGLAGQGLGEDVKRVFRLRRRSTVTHDTVLLELEPSNQEENEVVVLPLGYHVKVHAYLSGTEVVRSYTPISESWSAETSSAAEERTPLMCLAVKRYNAGTLTPMLTTLPADEHVTLSGPYGNFELHRLKKVTRLFLVAAGTGITPMLNLLTFMLTRRNPKCELIHLMFFNKKEADIMFREKLADISKGDDRLEVSHVLSEAGASWEGLRGRARIDLVEQTFTADALQCSDTCTHFATACGPAEFTHNTRQILTNLGLSEECFHAFLG